MVWALQQISYGLVMLMMVGVVWKHAHTTCLCWMWVVHSCWRRRSNWNGGDPLLWTIVLAILCDSPFWIYLHLAGKYCWCLLLSPWLQSWFHSLFSQLPRNGLILRCRSISCRNSGRVWTNTLAATRGHLVRAESAWSQLSQPSPCMVTPTCTHMHVLNTLQWIWFT